MQFQHQWGVVAHMKTLWGVVLSFGVAGYMDN